MSSGDGNSDIVWFEFSASSFPHWFLDDLNKMLGTHIPASLQIQHVAIVNELNYQIYIFFYDRLIVGIFFWSPV